MKQRYVYSPFVLTPPSKDEHLPYKVYVLYCPMARAIKYVGFCTGSPKKRFAQHVGECKSSDFLPRHKWFRRLMGEGHLPYMKVMASFSNKDEALLHEACLVRYLLHKRPIINKPYGMIDGFRLDKYYPCWLQQHGLQLH